MVLLVVDTQKLITNQHLYRFELFENRVKELIKQARNNHIEVIYVRHDDGAGSELTKATDGYEIYDGFKPAKGEIIFDKNVNSSFHGTGLLKYLREKKEDTIIVVGLQTDYCIDATIKCGFEHGFQMLVPANTNSTFDNHYMTAEMTYQYYNDFIWNGRYAKCISFEETLELMKSRSNIVLYSNKIDEYLKHDNVIDYDNKAIMELADSLFKKANNECDFIKAAYEFVRDNISHSADINEDIVTCTASEVLKAGHGICFAKSHLLAALLRCKSVPAGFCYQKLILDDETAPVLIYHGLNGVYLKDYKKWIRLDARGNKTGVNAQFSIETEQLAFKVRPEMGEADNFVVYPDPDKKILERLRQSKTRTELWNNLPTELEYNR